MRAAVFAFTARGCTTAEKIRESLPDALLFTVKRLARAGFSEIPKPSEAFYGAQFKDRDALIFVGACGIAVRAIAPHVRDKKTDPAVLVADEGGHFVISLLSGHIGGANALARTLAQKLGAVPVVTTATDVCGRFSVDDWAAEQDCAIGSMALAKEVSAAILERDLPLYSDLPLASALPQGLYEAQTGALGICISIYEKKPFCRTLNLIPRVVQLGLGCRKGTSREAIAQAVDSVLQEHGIDPRAIRQVSSIDLKQEEPGLLEFCRQRGLPVHFYSAGELAAAEGVFTPSAFVSQVTGVDNVCERAAVLGGGKLIVKKTVRSGVTVALAQVFREADFGKTDGSGHWPGK